MAILIASLAMLFVASLMGYLVIRARAEVWPPPGMPALPAGLWLSTVLLIASSFTIHRSLVSVRQGREEGFRRWLLLTLVLGISFLASQTVSWLELVRNRMPANVNLYAFTFYMLTGLHVLHVLGGLIPLTIVTRRAFLGRYRADFHPGVQYCAMYWHFLDGAWLVIFVLLQLGS